MPRIAPKLAQFLVSSGDAGIFRARMALKPDSFLRAIQPPDPATADEVSERVLDAALALACESGLRNVSVEDVAKRAGVGRVTIYRRFTDRATLMDTLFIRETRRCLETLRRAVDVKLPPSEQIVEGFVAALSVARDHPLLARLVRIEPATIFGEVSRPEVLGMLRQFMTMQLHAARYVPKSGGPDIETVAEVIVRLGLTFILMPGGSVPQTDEALRGLARGVLLPMVEQSLAAAPRKAK